MFWLVVTFSKHKAITWNAFKNLADNPWRQAGKYYLSLRLVTAPAAWSSWKWIQDCRYQDVTLYVPRQRSSASQGLLCHLLLVSATYANRKKEKFIQLRESRIGRNCWMSVYFGKVWKYVLNSLRIIPIKEPIYCSREIIFYCYFWGVLIF